MINSSEENVLSLAGNFSPSCDGHLVSVDKDEPAILHMPVVQEEKEDVAKPTHLVIHAMSHRETYTER